MQAIPHIDRGHLKQDVSHETPGSWYSESEHPRPGLGLELKYALRIATDLLQDTEQLAQ